VKKLTNLTVVAFIGPFIATFFVVLFVILIQFLWTYVDDLVGKGLEWYVILQLLFFASASFVPTALPLAVLLSSIMSFGKLAETYELVALKSAGVSLARIMVPMITLVSLIALGDFFFSNNVIPVANLKFHSLLWDIRQQRPALDIKEKVFYGGIDDYSIRIDKKDKNSQKMEGVTIYDHKSGMGNDVVMVAKSGEMNMTPNQRWLAIKLYDGSRYEEIPPGSGHEGKTYPSSRLNFKSYELKMDLSAFKLARTKEDLFKENSVMMNVNQLQYYEDSLKKILKHKEEVPEELTKPYFLALTDTNVVKKDKTSKTAISHLSENTLLLSTLPVPERKMVLMRASNNARALIDIFHSQDKDIEDMKKEIIRYKIEWHRKFAISIACLTLFFIGAPLGAIIRKGGIGYPTVVAIIMFLIYYIISIIGERAAKEDAITVVFGMWVSTIVLMPIGLFLTYMANRDAIGTNFIRGLTYIVRPFRKLFIKTLPGSVQIEVEQEEEKDINSI